MIRRPLLVRAFFFCMILSSRRITQSSAKSAAFAPPSPLPRRNLDRPPSPSSTLNRQRSVSVGRRCSRPPLSSASAPLASSHRGISTINGWNSRRRRSSFACRTSAGFHQRPHSPSARCDSLTKTMSASEGMSDIGKANDDGEGGNKSSGGGGGDPGNNDGIAQNWKSLIDVSIAKSRKIRGSNYVQISTIDRESMEPRCRTVVFRGFMKGIPFGAVKDVLPPPPPPSSSVGVASSIGESDLSSYYGDCVMKMITDIRSNKVRELAAFHGSDEDGSNKHANTVEMVWWFPKSSEQYRIRGRLLFLGSDGPLNSYAAGGATSKSHNDYFTSERKQQWGNLSDMAREQFYWDEPGVPFTSASGTRIPPGGRDEDGKVLPVPDTFLLMLLYPTKIDYLRLTDNYRQLDEWTWNGGGSAYGGRWESRRVNP